MVCWGRSADCGCSGCYSQFPACKGCFDKFGEEPENGGVPGPSESLYYYNQAFAVGNIFIPEGRDVFQFYSSGSNF
ncbi:hypothetical protein SAMN05661012_04890 [Chitinophaga sancti]|uniref:Uncharacterized protein n=1 Tax=Chitinophaga sancti TaxID=1004 RepID=A0A1K1S6R0_9BACT|nr:hypothetical protein SAMN05661012_04890 [Chitinophaga sancti]